MRPEWLRNFRNVGKTNVRHAQNLHSPELRSGHERRPARAMIVLIALAVVFIIYGALFYVANAPETDFPAPAGISYAKVVRNVASAVVILFLLDAAVFHSGWYLSLVEPNSHAGRVVALLHQQQQRQDSDAKQILVLGDSRMGVGFSEEMANAIAARRGVTFINRSLPASVPRLWYYLLRDIDPSARRYKAIVLPLKMDDTDARTATVHISQTAPLLRYADAFGFASSFGSWNTRCRAFVACVLRGAAYQPDLLDFLEHPFDRMKHLREPPRATRKATRRNVAGIEYDAANKKLTLPEGLTKRQRKSIRKNAKLLESSSCSGDCLAWTERILQKYDTSSTPVVIVRLAKGPLGSEFEQSGIAEETVQETLRAHKVTMIDPNRFAFLEQASYYADGFHLNRKGQEEFTRRLTEDLVARFANNDAGDGTTVEHR